MDYLSIRKGKTTIRIINIVSEQLNKEECNGNKTMVEEL
jgi:hypothetical protein